MNLTKWLEALAASYPNFQITKVQVFEYKQELETWIMTDEEWLELKSEARRRHKFFPVLSELEEVMHEVKRQTAAGKDSKLVWEIWKDEDGRCYARRPTK